MKYNANIDLPLMQRAISTENLKERVNINHNYGTNNFDIWVDSLLDKIVYTSVLDICCGTGNQLLKYAKRNKTAHIIGVDISNESLITADKRLQSIGASGYKLKSISMEKMFDDVDIKDSKFDLISCFYGLYYSQNATKILEQIINHLSPNGTVLIVGPYGKNNANLFDLLQKHYTLPELVIRSSTTFMEQEVFPILSESTKVSIETFVNPVRFPDVQSLIDYWCASTFYSSYHEKAVKRDIEEHFARHRYFIVEKHVMAYLARKLWIKNVS